MADLRPQRCQLDQLPFTCAVVNVFGPFNVQGLSQIRRYGCMHASFTSQAIHIELVTTFETEDIINGQVRFVTHRSDLDQVWSCNETNMVGTHSELARNYQQLDRAKLVGAARTQNTDWQFNLPHGSHHGGLWQRMLRIIMGISVAILCPSTSPIDDVLRTWFCEVKTCWY